MHPFATTSPILKSYTRRYHIDSLHPHSFYTVLSIVLCCCAFPMVPRHVRSAIILTYGLFPEPANSRSTARQKLTRLTRQQFQELSTDVYDELMRRKNNTTDNEGM